MPIAKLKEFLDGNGVRYVTISHSKAYTANEVAASAHVPGKSMAKTVMVKVDGRMAMAVLPAAFRVSFEQLRSEIGAMPPFGNLYGLPVYVADVLVENEEIAFNAGSHTEVIRLAYADFERLVNPRVLSFALQAV
jgi:Ala-tRNA(Pro) deacylase